MNPEAQEIFDKIIMKLEGGESLNKHDNSFLRARRSYLSNWQRIKFGDVLYLNRQFLFQKIRVLISFFMKFIKEIMVALVVGLILLLLG